MILRPIFHVLFLIGYNFFFLGGVEISESMGGQGCAILALELVPKNLIFA